VVEIKIKVRYLIQKISLAFLCAFRVSVTGISRDSHNLHMHTCQFGGATNDKHENVVDDAVDASFADETSHIHVLHSSRICAP